MTSEPPALFWKAPTMDLIERVRQLRSEGIGAWATIDAGPHVAVFCRRTDVAAVARALREITGVREVVETGPGPGVERL